MPDAAPDGAHVRIIHLLSHFYREECLCPPASCSPRTEVVSLVLWKKLPRGLLKKRFKARDRLGPDVKRLVVKLAEEQKLKCVHCPRERNLIIEHDHDPIFGTGDKLTAFNIRGLVCQRCNWHLMIYEKDLNGEYRGLDDVSNYISNSEWETYIYAHDTLVAMLYESQLEERMGTLKYLKRRIFLDKFDDWKEWGPASRRIPALGF